MDEGLTSSGRRRKPWLAIGIFAFGSLLLVPFFIPDPAPQFKFLRWAEINYIQVNAEPGGRIATTSYFVKGDSNSVAKAAIQELKSWRHSKSSLDTHEFERGGEHITIVDWNFGSKTSPQTHVLYNRPSHLVDELRSPVHRIKSWF
jgi:hypothetical protein